jgi:hypothetical protein
MDNVSYDLFRVYDQAFNESHSVVVDPQNTTLVIKPKKELTQEESLKVSTFVVNSLNTLSILPSPAQLLSLYKNRVIFHQAAVSANESRKRKKMDAAIDSIESIIIQFIEKQGYYIARDICEEERIFKKEAFLKVCSAVEVHIGDERQIVPLEHLPSFELLNQAYSSNMRDVQDRVIRFKTENLSEDEEKKDAGILNRLMADYIRTRVKTECPPNLLMNAIALAQELLLVELKKQYVEDLIRILNESDIDEDNFFSIWNQACVIQEIEIEKACCNILKDKLKKLYQEFCETGEGKRLNQRCAELREKIDPFKLDEKSKKEIRDSLKNDPKLTLTVNKTIGVTEKIPIMSFPSRFEDYELDDVDKLLLRTHFKFDDVQIRSPQDFEILWKIFPHLPEECNFEFSLDCDFDDENLIKFVEQIKLHPKTNKIVIALKQFTQRNDKFFMDCLTHINTNLMIELITKAHLFIRLEIYLTYRISGGLELDSNGKPNLSGYPYMEKHIKPIIE